MNSVRTRPLRTAQWNASTGSTSQAMPRVMGSVMRPLFSAQVEGHGLVRVTERGRIRQLWFVDGGGEAHLQTEVVSRPGGAGAPAQGPARADLAASLRRTPYLACMHRRIAEARPRRVLVLGLGGGLLPAALAAGGAEVLVVERSELVLGLARRFFAAGEPGLEVHLADAADFVHAAGEPFDACAIDVFEAHSYRLPDFVLSRRFHSALRARLRPGARVVQNALAHSGHIDNIGSLKVPSDEVAGCLVRRRGTAPRGPLWPGVYLRRNDAAAQLALLERAFRGAYGAARTHRPCPWAPSRVVEADAA